MKLFLFLLFFTISNITFAQSNFLLGKVTFKNQPVDNVFIEIKTKTDSRRAFSEKEGLFKINIDSLIADSVYISVYKEGSEFIIDSLIHIKSNEVLIISLKERITNLDEVVISSNKEEVIQSSNSTIHIINSKDFLKNNKGDLVLQTLPNVSISPQAVLVDNRKSALLFVDGIETSFEEVKRIEAKNIAKVEVISNPSSLYGEEISGAVIKITTTKPPERFYKGEISATRGIRLQRTNLYPTLSFKNKFITFKGIYSYTINNQNSTSDVIRYINNDTLTQSLATNKKGWQDYISGRIKIDISKKINLLLSANSYGYSFNGKSKGDIIENTSKNNFILETDESVRRITFNSIFVYSITEKSNLFIKVRHFDYKNRDKYNYNAISSTIKSKIKESTAELIYEKSQFMFFKKPTDLTAGYRSTFRTFDIGVESTEISQSIQSLFTDADILLSNKWSVYTSLGLAYTQNSVSNTNKKSDYFTILPIASILFEPNNKTSISLKYSRSITRPSSNYLNPNPIIINPFFILQGNLSLNAQVMDDININISSKITEKSRLSFTGYIENYHDLIGELLTQENQTVINRYENIGKATIYGSNINYTTKLFDKVQLNISNGISYNEYQTMGNQETLVKKNTGFAYLSSASIYTSIKEKVSIRFSGHYISNSYNLTQNRVAYPFLNTGISSNFFKDKLNIDLSYSDMFSLYANTTSKIQSANYYQQTNNSLPLTNLTLSLTYNFGKQFSDRFRNPTIQTDDIQTK